MQNAFVVK